MSSDIRQMVRLSDCASFQEGYVNPSQKESSYFGSDVKWLRATDLNNGFVFETGRRLSIKGFESAGRSATLFEPGSLAISKSGTIGRLGILKDYMCGNRAVINIKVDPSCDTRFIFYTLLLNRSKIELLAEGSVQKNLYVSTLGSLEIELPSLEEQKKISEIVGALDDRIALLCETNSTLEAIAQALFKSWFVDFDPVRAKQEGREPEGMDAETAALFPDSFEESELGLVPKGWRVGNFGDFITRLSVGKKYDNKTALPEGNVPILDQGKSGIIGFHNDPPSVTASLDEPIVVFANHTCYMRLISYDFSAIQNVLPFVGKDVDTVWAYYATKDRVAFSEYKGHWPDFVIEKAVIPNESATIAFRETTGPLIRRIRFNEQQVQTLTTLRDTLLPRLISGQLRLPDAEVLIEEAAA